MKVTFTSFLLILSVFPLFADHNGSIRGSILDAVTLSPLAGVSVRLDGPGKGQAYTDALGFYQFNNLPAGVYRININYLGYSGVDESVDVYNSETSTVKTLLDPAPIELKNVEISADPDVTRQTIPALDIHLRPVNTSQDILRMVPGLFIAQHAGGGKAEQIFLRGFDIDHGTDIALSVDGIPVNMVSHAHGQGYADLHFLIPEVVERVRFAKGPYYAPYGNLATAGYVDFQSKNALDQNFVKFDVGQFNTYRTAGGFKLLNKPESARPQNAYLATEYLYSNGYFDSPQAYNRFSAFFKYNAAIDQNNFLNASLSAFTSRWDASGQIPTRVVESGQIGRFGAIDDTEGGNTSRANLNFRLHSALGDGSLLKNQLYFCRYAFELYSNFTFFLNDPLNGDQIRQKETRNLIGYNGAYTRSDQLWGATWRTELGLLFRYDASRDNELSHTAGRQHLLDRKALGNIDETNFGVYLDEKIHFGNRFLLHPGIRFDQFQFMYVDKLQARYDRKIVAANLVSPKLNAYFTLNQRVQFFGQSGYGFHSNDTRVVVAQNGRHILPRALGFEAGATIKIRPRILLTLGAWWLHLDQEFVYVGDEAVVEPGGETTRRGIDLAIRWQLNDWLFADGDLNYTLARADGTPGGENYIPLAADWTSIGGLTFACKNGLNGSLRYRFIGNRPANEDNSVVAKGYFLTDAVLNFTRKRYEIGFSVQNLTNRTWNEAQFNTESRLFDETQAVSEIHFTPGTPFNLMVRFSVFF